MGIPVGVPRCSALPSPAKHSLVACDFSAELRRGGIALGCVVRSFLPLLVSFGGSVSWV